MKYIVLIAIVLLGATLRFYRLPEMANYDFDQEYASNFAYSVIREYPIQLIGQGLSVEGLFMGPLYFYYLVPFYFVSNLHPIGGFVGSVFLGLVTIVAYFFVANSLFGPKAGLIAAFLRATLFTSIAADWTMVPSYSSELAVILTWYCFYKYWHGITSIFPYLTFLFGLYTSFHPILFPLYLVFFVLLAIKRRLPKVRTLLLGVVSFIVPLIPLIIFEFLHQFLEIKRLFFVIIQNGGSSAKGGELSQFLYYNLTNLYNILNLSYLPKMLFSSVILGLFFLLVYKGYGFFKDSFHQTALAVTYFLFILYYYFFPTHVSEYYFQALNTLVFFYFSGILSLLINTKALQFILLLVLITIVYFNFRALRERWNNPSLITLYHKDSIVKEILERRPKDQEFYVSYIREPGWNFGFNYLFKLYNQVPQTREAKPPVYTIVIPKSYSLDSINVSSGNIGIILPK